MFAQKERMMESDYQLEDHSDSTLIAYRAIVLTKGSPNRQSIASLRSEILLPLPVPLHFVLPLVVDPADSYILLCRDHQI